MNSFPESPQFFTADDQFMLSSLDYPFELLCRHHGCYHNKPYQTYLVSYSQISSVARFSFPWLPANGHASVLQNLIEQGVDVNASNVEQNTPLHWACLNGHIEVVKLLVLAGANVSALNSHEKTPVDEAAGRGKMDVIDSINETLAQPEITSTRMARL